MEEGVQKEREILQGIKQKADYVIDTSNLLTRELKEEIDHIFVRNEEYNSLMVNILSFGFKNGIPADADLVFDVRFLPNPFYIDELKHKTGNDKEVQDYVMSFPEAGEFLQKLVDMLDFLIPNYVKEGKHQLVIGIGCTGGKHRSVTLANELYAKMKNHGNYGTKLYHRDIKQGVWECLFQGLLKKNLRHISVRPGIARWQNWQPYFILPEVLARVACIYAWRQKMKQLRENALHYLKKHLI